MATSMLADIDGLARWHQPTPEVAAAALARLDDILDEALSRHSARRPAGCPGVVAGCTLASGAPAAALGVKRTLRCAIWSKQPA
jgi:class 3 adenylate cyclase